MAQLLKIKGQVPSMWAKGCMFGDCVCYMTWHDYPSLGKSRYIITIFFTKCRTHVDKFGGYVPRHNTVKDNS